MEDPDGEILELGGVTGVSASADRGNGGEPIRVRGGEGPGAVAAHAQAGEVNAVLVDPVVVDHVIEQGVQGVGVPASAGALRRDQDEGEILALGDQLGRAVELDLLEVIARLAGSVQEEHQGPFLVFLLIVSLG